MNVDKMFCYCLLWICFIMNKQENTTINTNEYVNVYSPVWNIFLDKIFCDDNKIHIIMIMDEQWFEANEGNHNIKTLVASLVG